MAITYPTNIKVNNIIVGDQYEARIQIRSNLTSSVAPSVVSFTGSSAEQNLAIMVTQNENDMACLIVDTYNVSKNILNTEQVLVKCTEKNLC